MWRHPITNDLMHGVMIVEKHELAPKLTPLSGGWEYETSDFEDGYILYGPARRPVVTTHGVILRFPTVLSMRVWLRDHQGQPEPFAPPFRDRIVPPS